MKLRIMRPEEATAVLKKGVDQTADPILRARALWQMSQVGPVDMSKGTDLMLGFERAGVDDARFRILCVRILRDLTHKHGLDDLPGRLLYWSKSKEPEVRREILLSLRDAEPAKARPLILDLARNDADKQALRLGLARLEYGRPFFLPPGVPAERVAALRRAFDATMRDQAFVAEAAKLQFDVDPLSGEQVQALVAQLAATPREVVARVRAALEAPAQ